MTSKNIAATTPRFARIWRGRTTRDKADEYERYWLETGIGPLIAKGALSVQMLREDRANETEFVTISWWTDIEAMAPGDDPYRAHHLQRDRDFLLELPERVQILRVLERKPA
jgi:heme-degrading monooxygenase HmoA